MSKRIKIDSVAIWTTTEMNKKRTTNNGDVFELVLRGKIMSDLKKQPCKIGY